MDGAGQEAWAQCCPSAVRPCLESPPLLSVSARPPPWPGTSSPTAGQAGAREGASQRRAPGVGCAHGCSLLPPGKLYEPPSLASGSPEEPGDIRTQRQSSRQGCQVPAQGRLAMVKARSLVRTPPVPPCQVHGGEGTCEDHESPPSATPIWGTQGQDPSFALHLTANLSHSPGVFLDDLSQRCFRVVGAGLALRQGRVLRRLPF